MIHTDSKSVLLAVQREDIKGNSLLMPSIMACPELHKVQNGPVCQNWIPSHIRITRNELADRLVNDSLRSETISIKVQCSLGQIKRMVKEYERKRFNRKLSNVDRYECQICHMVLTGHTN